MSKNLKVHRMDDLYVVVVKHPDTSETLMSVPTEFGMIPVIATSEEGLADLYMHSQLVMHHDPTLKAVVCCYSHVEDVTEIAKLAFNKQHPPENFNQ